MIDQATSQRDVRRYVGVSQLWEDKINRFLDHARGVVHIGANTGQEARIYADRGLPVIWVEPLEGVFEALQDNIAEFSNQKAYQYLLTDRDGDLHRFGVSNNGAQSSSIFDFADHRKIWPEVHYLGHREETSTTFQTMVEREGIDLAGFDALIMDVQGAELLVLKGIGPLLDRFTWIRAECADFEIYKDGCELSDLDDYLIPRGWDRADLWRGLGRPGVGNCYEALYRRRNENTW